MENTEKGDTGRFQSSNQAFDNLQAQSYENICDETVHKWTKQKKTKKKNNKKKDQKIKRTKKKKGK